jgi:hypothetical protein
VPVLGEDRPADQIDVAAEGALDIGSQARPFFGNPERAERHLLAVAVLEAQRRSVEHHGFGEPDLYPARRVRQGDTGAGFRLNEIGVPPGGLRRPGDEQQEE